MDKEPKEPRRIAMVTIGTDGVVDYVQVHDQRYMLGPVSVLKLISKLVPTRMARKALDEFLDAKQVMVSVDLDKMWALLPFRRARYSSTNPSITNPLIERFDHHHFTPAQRELMSKDFSLRLARLEEQLSIFENYDGRVTASMNEARIASLVGLIDDLSRTAGLPPEFLEQQKKMKDKAKDKDDDKKEDKKEASYATFMVHTAMAEDIVNKVASTDTTIDRLVAAGKRFNSVRAKSDLYKIASRVAEISQSVDLGQSWVGGDLGILSQQANEIHDLFAPKG